MIKNIYTVYEYISPLWAEGCKIPLIMLENIRKKFDFINKQKTTAKNFIHCRYSIFLNYLTTFQSAQYRSCKTNINIQISSHSTNEYFFLQKLFMF